MILNGINMDFEHNSKKYHWEIVHNLEKYDLDIKEQFKAYQEEWKDNDVSIADFCGFVYTHNNQIDGLICLPKERYETIVNKQQPK